MKLSGLKLSALRRGDYLAVALACAFATIIFATLSLQIQAAGFAIMTASFAIQYYRFGKRRADHRSADEIPAKDAQDGGSQGG